MKRILIVAITLMTSVMAFAQAFHDAALFNAPFDRVKYIDYADGRICFTENGGIDKPNSTYLALYDTYKIERDADGYPTSVTTDFDKTTIEYDANRRIKKRTVKGNGTVVLTYEYFPTAVKETRVTVEGGQPKKQETVYDRCEFDNRGNWIKKGINGTAHEDAHVEYEHYGTIGTGGIRENVTTTTYYEGRSNENRFIAYWSEYNFKKSDSPKEVSFIDALKHPFFLNVNLGVEPKELEKELKKSKLPYRIEKGYVKHRDAFMDKCDRLCYGYPLIDLHAEYFRDHYSISDYSVTIAIPDKREAEDLFVFIMDELKKQGINYKLELPDHVNKSDEIIRFEYNLMGFTEERIKQLEAYNIKHTRTVEITKTDKGIMLKTK